MENGHSVSAIRIRHVAPTPFGARVTQFLSLSLLFLFCLRRSAVRMDAVSVLAEKIHFNRHNFDSYVCTDHPSVAPFPIAPPVDLTGKRSVAFRKSKVARLHVCAIDIFIGIKWCRD